MAKCVMSSNGYIVGSKNYCDYVLITPDELEAIQLAQTDWDYYLDFDRELFDLLIGYSLTTFIVGHTLGRILKSLGKV